MGSGLAEVSGCSAARAGDAEPHAHEVSAAGEHDVALAAEEPGEGPAIVLEEAHEPPEGFDPLPLVLGRDPGVQDAPELVASRAVGVLLLEHASSAQHGHAARLALGS